MAPKPIFTKKPSIRLLKDLKSMILETSFLPQNNSVEVKWIFDGNQIVDDQKYKTRVKYGDATLKIKSPTANDSGKYICVLTAKNGSVKQHIQVEVLKDRSKNAPIFVEEPTENWIEEKSGEKKLILKFSIQSGTTNAYFHWTKDDQPLKSSNRISMKSKEESDGKYSASLEIKDPDSDEVGEYLCTVKNDFGQLQAIFNLEGEVSPKAPEFTRKPLIIEKKEEESGEHVTVFDVAFRTIDDPIVTWFDPKNNVLSTDERMKIYLEKDESAENMYTAILELKNYQESDNGIFLCQIQNKTTKEISLAEIFLNIEF
uniref:Ig-like domain-containing protein n=1 Tax=Panagrolaimus superbus TaxID=310955 RepID=A0A914Z4F2_9BILA